MHRIVLTTLLEKQTSTSEEQRVHADDTYSQVSSGCDTAESTMIVPLSP
jgi:hypothetical protein